MIELAPENPAEITAFAGFLLVLAFYGLGWWLAGRDPLPESGNRGTLPEKLSPAALRLARRMAADTGAAAASLMALASRGQLTVELQDGSVRLRKCDGSNPELPRAEAALAHDLLYTRSTLRLHNSASRVVAPALDRFRSVLSAEYGRSLFRTNRGWLIAGLGLSALTLAAAAAQSGAPGAFLLLSALAIATVAGLAALMQAFLPRRYIFPEPLSRGLRSVLRRAVEAGFIVVASPLAFVALADLVADPPVPLSAVGFVAALAGLHVAVYHLMKAPTAPGATMRAQIEDFREALAVGSGDAGALPLPGGIYAFALDLPGETALWESPPAWLRLVGPQTGAPRGFGELGELLTRALDAASMPPAGTLFPKQQVRDAASGRGVGSPGNARTA